MGSAGVDEVGEGDSIAWNVTYNCNGGEWGGGGEGDCKLHSTCNVGKEEEGVLQANLQLSIKTEPPTARQTFNVQHPSSRRFHPISNATRFK